VTFENVVFPTLGVLVFWVFVALMLAGCGHLLRRLLAPFLPGGREVGGLVVGDLWVGFAGLLAYVLLWNLVLAVTWAALVVPVVAGVAGLVVGGRGVRRPRRVSPVVAGAGGLAILWVANASLGPAGDYDYGLYHLNLIGYALKYPAVPGLADLHTRLGAGDAHLLFVALLDHGPLAPAVPHLVNGLLLSLLLVDLFARLAVRPVSEWFLSFTGTLAVLLVPAVLTAAAIRPTHRISSPDLDFATFVLVIVGALYLADCVENGFSAVPALVSTCAFAAASATRPLYWLWAAFALVVVGLRARRSRAVLALCVLPALLAVGWLARQAVLSGYPFYPLSALGLPVDWRLPASLLNAQTRVDFAWARDPGVDPNVVLGSWHWLSAWWIPVFQRSLDAVLPATLFVLAAVGAVALKVRGSVGSGRGKPMLALLVPSLVSISIWFWTIPDPRFVWAPIWLVPLSVAAWALPARVPHPRAVEVVLALVVVAGFAAFGYEHRLWLVYGVGLAAVLVAGVLVLLKRRDLIERAMSFAVLTLLIAEVGIAVGAAFGGIHLNAGDGHGPLGTPRDTVPRLVTVTTASGLALSKPPRSDQCWAQLLCVPRLLGPQLHLRGSSVRDGFSLSSPG
jgi:hypothetical protein